MERLVPGFIRDEQDEFLAKADDDLSKLEPTLGGVPMQASDGKEDPDECPFELGLGEPIVCSAAKLWRASGREPPPEFSALDPHRLLAVVLHQMTPFPRPGHPPTRVWGMGLRVELPAGGAYTVDYAPKSEFEELADADANVTLGVSSKGNFSIAPEDLAIVSRAAGVGIDEIGVSGGANAGVRFAIKVNVSSLRVQAGPMDRGVRWDLMRDDRRASASVRLFQTLAVPNSQTALSLRMTAWVRRRRFFGRPDARIWTTPSIDKVVEITL